MLFHQRINHFNLKCFGNSLPLLVGFAAVENALNAHDLPGLFDKAYAVIAGPETLFAISALELFHIAMAFLGKAMESSKNAPNRWPVDAPDIIFA
jgi:hypothetical protein